MKEGSIRGVAFLKRGPRGSPVVTADADRDCRAFRIKAVFEKWVSLKSAVKAAPRKSRTWKRSSVSAWIRCSIRAIIELGRGNRQAVALADL
jgi:hypothetical protein